MGVGGCGGRHGCQRPRVPAWADDDGVEQIPTALADQWHAGWCNKSEEGYSVLIDLASLDPKDRGESDRAVCRRISIALRRFVGIVCDNDLDYEGLDDLSRRADEDARLKPVVEVVKRCYQVEFDPSGHDVDPDELVSMAVRTVRSWS